MNIKVLRNVLEANDQLAARIRAQLTAKRITAINLISAPGAGKTSLLEQTIPALQSQFRIGVLEGDIATTRDAERIGKLGVPVVQLLTGGACHLEAPLVEHGLAELDLDSLDLVFIENVGNIACPAEFDLGETAKVGILSVTEGHDKPAKYPLLFHEIRALVLNKIDLLPHTDFDFDEFLSDFRKLNVVAPVFQISCRSHKGIREWTHWLEHAAHGDMQFTAHSHDDLAGIIQPHTHPHKPGRSGVPAAMFGPWSRRGRRSYQSGRCMKTRVRAKIAGRVQGVGFRPTVYRYATQFGLCGFVCNGPHGVTLEVEGEDLKIAAFFHQLTSTPPKQAVIAEVHKEFCEEKGYHQFKVIESETDGDALAHVSPDLAMCEDCARELLDPRDRRHGYPFINCTNCGPRFTIIRDLPYDRVKTSMAKFTMCEPCDHEYHDPQERRFHAQPNACEDCGPSLELVTAENYGREPHARRETGREDASRLQVARAVELLRCGQIVALKSLGGYHLACDALNPAVMARLRQRKHRPHKPLAVMFRDIAAVKKFCDVSEVEEAELLSVARPIVVLTRRGNGVLEQGSNGNSHTPSLHHSISPDAPSIGAFLPYTPLHHLLFEEFEALVMTSGNLTDEPIISDEVELAALLGPIADAALTHNRPITHKCDDTVLKVVNGQRQFLRRARGFVPNPIRIAPADRAPHILAVGGELKNTFCLVRDGHAFVSQHLGDLKDCKTYSHFSCEIESWKRLMRIEPQVIAHDLHPSYLSTRYAAVARIPNKIGVQHHHAHIASVMAEHDLHEPVIGVALDGTGYGTDGTIWGGEFLVADRCDFERIAHFKTYRLPGGDKAVEEPWRMALSVLTAEGLDGEIRRRFPAFRWRLVEKMVQAGFNSPLTSSAGRLFDAVAAILGLCDVTTYEAQAAIRLEAIADRRTTDSYPFAVDTRDRRWVVDFGPTIRAILEEHRQRIPVGEISAKFHNTVAASVLHMCRLLRGQRNLHVVALSGGVFQNELLLRRTVELLRSRRFRVFTNAAVPLNDGGLALGQAAVAAERIKQGCV